MAVINEKTRKVIKNMAYVCQAAQFVSLMPKPKDFVTRLVGDVVYLSAKVVKLSDDINKLLDQYANIPANYLMTQINTITGSASSIVNRINTYAQNGVTQTLDAGGNALSLVSELTGGTIDVVNETSKAVVSLSSTVAHTQSAILGQTEVASDIYDATEVVLEWTNDGFEKVKSTNTAPLNNAVNTITNAKNNINSSINNTANTITDSISSSQQWVETLLDELKEKMDKLSSIVDSGFSDVTGISSVSTGASYVSDALKSSDNSSESAQITTAVSESLSKVLKNFSISKVIKAFGGVVVQSVIVKEGLDKLPPIDFESMLARVRNDMTISNEELYSELNLMIEEIPSEDHEYKDDNYKEFMEQFEDIKKQRDEIRLSMHNRAHGEGLTDKEFDAKRMRERRALRSAIKEMQKFRKQTKDAKQTSKFIDIIDAELLNLKKEVEYKCNSIKSDWNDMMDTYRKALNEIKSYFKDGGDGDMYIDDCCDDINEDCQKIKELCKNLKSQLIYSVIKVAMPADVGSVVPNPAYKISDFIMDIKTIIKFIKDLITLVMDILNNVNKLARIMLNGVNNLNDIVSELTELLGLQWFMDLVQSILDFFGGKIKSAKLLLKNMVSPVHYSDTDEYDNTLDTLENFEDGEISIDELANVLCDENRFFSVTKKTVNSFSSYNESKDDNDYDKFLDELDEKADEVVAYRSPILDDTEDYSNVNVSDIMNGGDFDTDVKFKGWIYFHPNLNHTGNSYYSSKRKKKVKSKIIKKASKKSNKKKGGLNMLNNKHIKGDTAYSVFYWYTYYTEDMDNDGLDLTTAQDTIKIDSTFETQNGTIVQLNDGRKVFVADSNVKKGDYVTVDGVKYRVSK